MTMRDASEVIAPCPFCGKPPVVLPLDPATEGDAWTRIVCDNKRCGASAAAEHYSERGHRAAAIKKWNRRALPAASTPQADRLALRMLVAAGFVTQDKANEALQIAHGFDKGPLTPQPASADVVDARRYRFLRDNCKREWESQMPETLGAPSLDIEFEAPGTDLDAAIDAAIQADNGAGGITPGPVA